MFNNATKLLKKENDNITRWMDEDDEDIIDSIMESLGIFRVNSFDAQVIRRDLIGMAQESRLRGSSMKEVIGDDIKLITYDIIKNSRGSSKREILLLYLRFITGIVIISLGLFGVINLAEFSWEVNLVALLTFIESITGFFFIAKLVRPLLNMEGWSKFGFYWTMLRAISTFSYAFVFGISGSGFPLYENHSIYINKAYVLIISSIVYLASEYFYRKTIRELSRNKSNCYEDLN